MASVNDLSQRRLLLCVLLFFFVSCKTIRNGYTGQQPFDKVRLLNLDFRQVDSLDHPVGWRIPATPHYEIYLDTAMRRQGYAAFSLRKTDSAPNSMQVFARFLPLPVRGDTLEFSADIKTENITEGSAGLIAMVLDKQKQKLSYKAMVMDGVSGTHDWTRRMLKLPIDVVHGDSIYVIGVLAGNGHAWIGNLDASIDGRPLATLSYKLPPSDPNSAEALGYAASTALTGELSPAMTFRLTNLGMLWGFLKYYHPAVGQGRYDWDSALFKILPSIVRAPDEKTVYRLEEEWVRRTGKVAACKSCALTDSDGIKVPANYGYLFDSDRFPESLRRQMAWIRDNHSPVRGNYYVSYRTGQLEFIHEEKYVTKDYPPAALRLLSLYRLWNMVQYYFPYRYLITEDWNKMLATYMPRFIGAKNSGEYALSCLELIGHIHDTHANIWNERSDLDSIKGLYRAPFKAVFAEHRLVVTGYLVDSPDIRSLLPLGAVIHGINGITTDSLVRKFLPLTPASNAAAQLRDLPSSYGFLLRSNREVSEIEFEHHDSIRRVRLPGVPVYSTKHLLKLPPALGDKGFDHISPDIGYIRPERLSAKAFTTVRQSLDSTKGLIIDFRGYPSSFMVYTYGSWLKGYKSPFAFSTSSDIRRPGCMSISPPNENGGNWGVSGPDSTGADKVYKGKVIILVNAATQSQGEYTTMALQSTEHVRVLGSTTAGADGDISYVWLPGNILTQFSGVGIYYPDGGGTQRVGVRIDVPVEVSVKGLQEGRDELLEAAIRILRDG